MTIKCVTVLMALGLANLPDVGGSVDAYAQMTGLSNADSPVTGSLLGQLPDPLPDQLPDQQLRARLRRLQTGAESVPELSVPNSEAIAPFPAPFPTLGSAVFDAQLAGYMDYVAANGTPDILIVGSSRSLQGIDPEALRYRLSEQGYGDLKVYNFSVNGATAQVVNFILSELLPGDLPEVIVWGDGSRAFNNGRRDRTWEGLTASPGYQAMLRGEKPAIASTPISSVLEAVESGAVESGAVELEAVEPEAELLTGLLTIEPVWSELIQSEPIQSELTQSESDLLALLRTAALSSRVDVQRSASVSRLNSLGLDDLGFAAIGDRFDPVAYYQTFPQVSGRYDGAYSPFSLQGDQTVALVQAARFVRSQSAQLIFVNLPLSDSYLDEFRRYHEQQFQQFLQTQSDRHGFQVVDLLTHWQGQPDLFADPSHVNRYGAAAIAARLALDPTLLLALDTSAADSLQPPQLQPPWLSDNSAN